MSEKLYLKKSESLTKDAKNWFDNVKCVYVVENVYGEEQVEFNPHDITKKLLENAMDYCIEFESGKRTVVAISEWAYFRKLDDTNWEELNNG